MEDRTAALDYLKRLGYYRLSGYWYHCGRWTEQHQLGCVAPCAMIGLSLAAALRTWNIKVVEISQVPEGWPQELKPSRPFLYFCLIQQLMRVTSPNSSWGQRYKALLAEEFPRLANQQLSLKNMGVVEGWEDWPVWRGQ